MGYSDYDWRKLNRGWQYEGNAPRDKKWQEDRQKLFEENGNGWWWFTSCKSTHIRESQGISEKKRVDE